METTYKQIQEEARRLAQNKKRLRLPPRVFFLLALLSIIPLIASVWIESNLVFFMAVCMLVADIIIFVLLERFTIVLGRISESDIQLMIPEAIEAREIELREDIKEAEEWVEEIAEEKQAAIGQLEEARNGYAQFRMMIDQLEGNSKKR